MSGPLTIHSDLLYLEQSGLTNGRRAVGTAAISLVLCESSGIISLLVSCRK